MKQLSIGLAIWMAAGSAAASAQEAAPDEAQREKKICRSEKATGSLTRRARICMTRAEWDALSARSRQGVQDFQNSASGSRVTPICDASGQGPGCQPVGSPGGAVGL